MTTGTIRGLKEKYPDSIIDYMTSQQYANILEDNSDIDKIINWGSAINQNDYDLILWPHHKIRNAAFGRQDVHLADIYARLCGVERRDLYVNPDDSYQIDLPKNFITVHTTSHPMKNYDRFNEVVELLKDDIDIVQIGGKDDIAINATKTIINLCGKLTYRQTAFIIKKSKLHIGIDSCCGHIASAVNKLSIILFGGTGARVVRPISNNIAIEPDYLMHCSILSPCYGIAPWPCNNKCINTIDPNILVENIRRNIK